MSLELDPVWSSLLKLLFLIESVKSGAESLTTLPALSGSWSTTRSTVTNRPFSISSRTLFTTHRSWGGARFTRRITQVAFSDRVDIISIATEVFSPDAFRLDKIWFVWKMRLWVGRVVNALYWSSVERVLVLRRNNIKSVEVREWKLGMHYHSLYHFWFPFWGLLKFSKSFICPFKVGGAFEKLKTVS